MITRKRLIDVSKRNLFAGLILALLVMPFVIQGQYDPTGMELYNGFPVTETVGYDPLTADMSVDGYYRNTSGNGLWLAAMAETYSANGTWTVDWAAVAQDEDKNAFIGVKYGSSGVESDTWNWTAFDSDTTDNIVAFSFRIKSPTLGAVFAYEIGFDSDPDYWSGTIVSSETSSLITLTAADYAWIDEYQGIIDAAADGFTFWFLEADATELIDTNEIEFEIHFYASVSMDTFNEYVLYSGLIMIFMALAETRHFNPTGRSGRRRGSRRYHRYRGRARRWRRRRR